MIQISKDALWKAIIEDLFDDFLLYFYPNLTKDKVDFSKPFEFLDKELDDLFPTEAKKKRYTDKLVKIRGKAGSEY